MSKEDQERLATFTRALPAYVSEQPNDALATALVPRLAEAARTGVPATEPRRVTRAPRPRRSRRTLVARVAVAVALIPAFTAALAVAGVKVPEPARDAFEGIGVELPNQGDDAEGGSNESGGGGEATDEAPQAAPADEPAKASGKAKAQKRKPAEKAPQGKARGQETPSPSQTAPNGKALGHDKGKAKGGSSQGGGKGAAKDKGGGSGNGGGSPKVKKTPPGQAKKEPKPAPPGQAKLKE